MGKTAIFLDIDGVLNELYSENPYWEEYKKAEKELDEYEEMNKEIKGTPEWEEGFDKLFDHMADLGNKVFYTEESKYLSENAVRRVKEICDETGAVVVLNGSQSKPLMEDTWFKLYWDGKERRHNGYITKDGKRIMDIFKEYDIPIEGYSYDISRDEYKLWPVFTYIAKHKDIKNFLIIEDMDFGLDNDHLKDVIRKRILQELLDDRMNELIENMSKNNAVCTSKGDDRGLNEYLKQEAIDKINALNKQ